MHSWDWFDEYEWHAQSDGDEERLPLGYLHREAYRFRESDPDHALSLIAQGRALAERLREPWWVLYYDQQRVHALLHFKQDYSDVLDLAVRNTLEVRKSAYTDFPRRLMIHGDLVSAYLGHDPVGYAEPIHQALNYLDTETPPDGDDRYLVLGSRRQFALDRGQLDEAEAYSQRSLELASADADRGRASHFLVFTYSGLCEIAWRKGDWEMLADACQAGEEMAQLVGHKVELAGFWMWQALVHRRRGVPGRAEQLSRRAVRRLEGLGMPPDSSFRDAECAYHEQNGALERALLAREAELSQLEGRGRLALECASLIQRAWLLYKLGRLEDADLVRCRRASQRLRQPGPALLRIERIQRGEGAMTIWDWIHNFEMDARAAGDTERLRMTRIHNEAYSHRQTDPDRMLALLEEGRRLAQALQEPWWVVFFDHWKLETWIYYKDDYREVIDLAVRLTLELRKPAYESFPLRFGIWCNLVAAYLCVDPIGYRRAIQEAIEYLMTEVPPEGGDRYLLQARRHWFAYEVGELEEAHRLALEELALADSDPDRHTAQHHEVDTYKALCWIAYRRKDWPGLAAYAGTGEERARLIGYRYELALFLLWRAVCARRDRREDEAKRLCRQGTSQMARLGQPPGESYYDALAEYHELGENLEAAWQVRQRELETTVGKGQIAYECQVRIKRVRLLKRLGQPYADEERLAREVARKLREPARYLGELEKILRE